MQATQILTDKLMQTQMEPHLPTGRNMLLQYLLAVAKPIKKAISVFQSIFHSFTFT